MTTDHKEDPHFTYGETSKPHTFIQYKGTSICLDIHCTCGAHSHFDGYFAYVVQCPKCKACWEMPWNLFPRLTTDPEKMARAVESEIFE